VASSVYGVLPTAKSRARPEGLLCLAPRRWPNRAADRNRAAPSIVETMVVVEWWPPGGGTADFRSSGRSVPPRNDFDQKDGDSGRWQTGFAEFTRRSHPTLFSPFIDVVDFVSPR
jgi:hypothetical protein